MFANTILALDVGNSRIKFGVFECGYAPSSGRLPACRNFLSVAHAEPIPWETITDWLLPAAKDSSQSVMAGVNPAAIERILAEWPTAGWPRPVLVDTVERSLEVRLEAPQKVGIDRLLNAVAANVIRPEGKAAIVVSSGTATTIDLVSMDGAFLGGAILPGFELAARSLHEHTALLPLVPIADLAASNLPPLGRDTPAAIRSGLLYGHVGSVKELVARLSDHAAAALVIVTGGNGPLLAPHLGREVRLEPHLAMQGLARVVTAP